MAAVLSAGALLGCTSATLRYVAPAHDEALDARNVRLTWKVTPAETPLDSCVVSIGDEPNLNGARKTLLSNDAASPESMVSLGNGNYGYDFDLVPGTYSWRVSCDGPRTRRLVSLDGSTDPDDGATVLNTRVRRFMVIGGAPVAAQPRAIAKPVANADLPDILRPVVGTPPAREGTVGVVGARWDGTPNPTFTAELEARLVEAGFVLQQGDHLVPTNADTPTESAAPRPFKLLGDSLVFGFDTPTSATLVRPDRFLLVDAHMVTYDAELAGSPASPRSLRAVYARFVDAKTGRVQWSDRFYVAPSVSMNRVVTELLRR